MSRWKNLVNSNMIWGALLGWMIYAGAATILEAGRHQGPGYVTYEEPDRTVKVSEGEYHRHNYVMGGMLLALGLWFWSIVARSAKPPDVNAADDNLTDFPGGKGAP